MFLTRSLCNLILNYYSDSYSVFKRFILRFFCENGGGGDDELSFRFIVLLLHGLSCVYKCRVGMMNLVYGSLFPSYVFYLGFYSDE